MMKSHFRSVLLFVPCLVLCLAASGCGGGGSKVTGKVVNNGQPFSLSDKGLIQLLFIPEGHDQGQQFPASTNKPDGSFEVAGPEGKGLPPGKYRISVQVFDPYPTTDKLDGKFLKEKSPIVKDISGSQSITIDVAKPEG